MSLSCCWQLLAVRLFVLLGSFVALVSQGYSYVDEAGNIHFVERLDQIPSRYKHQVLKPSPTIDPTQFHKLLKQKLKKTPAKKVTKTPTPKAKKSKTNDRPKDAK